MYVLAEFFDAVKTHIHGGNRLGWTIAVGENRSRREYSRNGRRLLGTEADPTDYDLDALRDDVEAELRELEGGSAPFAWVELWQRGGKRPLFWLEIDLRRNELDMSRPDAAAVGAVVNTNGMLRGIVLDLLRENRTLLGKVAETGMQMVELVAYAEAQEEIDRSKMLSGALEKLAPVAQRAVEVYAAKMAREAERAAEREPAEPPPDAPTTDDGQVDPDELAERVVRDLQWLGHQHPEALTPPRMMRVWTGLPEGVRELLATIAGGTE